MSGDGDQLIGSIGLFAGNFAPRGWALCQGQLLPISQNTALFSILGTIYGGDGRTTFALPDLRGRVAIQQGRGPGLPSYQLGQRSGAPTTTLTVTNLPSHNHTGSIQVGAEGMGSGATTTAAGSYLGNAQDSMYRTVQGTAGQAVNGVITSNTGGSQSFNNMQPYNALNYCIALVGIYPSRN